MQVIAFERYISLNKLPEVPEYAKMQFNMMTLLDVPGKIPLVRLLESIMSVRVGYKNPSRLSPFGITRLVDC